MDRYDDGDVEVEELPQIDGAALLAERLAATAVLLDALRAAQLGQRLAAARSVGYAAWAA